MRFLALTIVLCATVLAAACSHNPSLTDPCDVLVPLEPAPATASFIVKNDRRFAQAVAMHRGRYERYGCGS